MLLGGTHLVDGDPMFCQPLAYIVGLTSQLFPATFCPTSTSELEDGTPLVGVNEWFLG